MDLGQPTVAEVEDAIGRICDQGGLRRPDRVERDGGEVLAFWDAEKLAVVIEPGPSPRPG